MKSRPRLAILEALMAVILWGLSFVATKLSLRTTSPEVIVWLRFSIGVIILVLAVIAGKKFALPEKRDWGYLALLGFLGITFHQWLQSTGLQTAQATTTSWILATTPVFMALLGWIVLKEGLSWWQAAGILLAGMGVLVVVTRGDLVSLLTGNIGTRGDLLILISAVNWAIFSALSRRGLQKYPAILMIFYVMTFGWLFSSVLFLVRGGFAKIGMIPLESWMGIAFLGVFCSGFAYIFWYHALKILPVAQSGAFLYLEPVVTVIAAAFFLGEAITMIVLVGGGLILVGIWLVNWRHVGKKPGS